MNQAHLHLLFNHFPIIGAFIGVFTLITGFMLANSTIKRTALGIFIFSALCAIPSFFTGGGAEIIVKEIQSVSRKRIHHHEEQAAVFMWVICSLGVFSLITLVIDKSGKGIRQAFYFICLILGFASMIFGQKAGTSGGEIRHSEITEGGIQQGEMKLQETPIDSAQSGK